LKPVGFLNSDKIKFKESVLSPNIDYTFPPKLLFQGTQQDVQALMELAEIAGSQINQKNIGYPPAGLFPSEESRGVSNSNAVISTLLKAMGIADPYPDLPAPGRGVILLSPQEINEIQESKGFSPTEVAQYQVLEIGEGRIRWFNPDDATHDRVYFTTDNNGDVIKKEFVDHDGTRKVITPSAENAEVAFSLKYNADDQITQIESEAIIYTAEGLGATLGSAIGAVFGGTLLKDAFKATYNFEIEEFQDYFKGLNMYIQDLYPYDASTNQNNSSDMRACA
jgi:hypothetical protein